MKYNYEQRLEIGREIYFNELSKYTASIKYGISSDSARDYMRLFRDVWSLPAKNHGMKNCFDTVSFDTSTEYKDKTRAELIAEIVKLRSEAKDSELATS